MTTLGNKQHEIDLLLSALREKSDDPELDQLAMYSLLAGISDDEVLNNAAIAEVGPEQAELDIHLDGSSIEHHSAKAEPFGLFVAKTAEAVKEMAKTALGRQRYTSDLLISATMPGSLRVVLRAPERADRRHSVLETTSSSNVESNSLRTIAILLSQAGSDADDTGPAAATIEQLSPAARDKVRSALHQVTKSGWNIEGELRQKGVGIVRINLGNERAARLEDQLGQTETTVEKGIIVIGSIDGTRRFTGSMWFQPEKADKPFVASVTDASLLERVNEINVPDARVRATFDRYKVFRGGNDQSRSRTTYLLTGIEAIDSSDSPGLLSRADLQ